MPVLGAPASQAAGSKLCNGFAWAPPDRGEDFWRSSNSAFISGSTVEMISYGMQIKGKRRTVIHDVWHAEDNYHTDSCNQDHRVLK